MNTLKAKSGTCIVEPYEKYGDREGLIWIPEVGKYVSGRSGKVLSVGLYQDGCLSVVWRDGQRRAVYAYRQNDTYKDLKDKHIMFSTGVEFIYQGKTLFVVRLEHVLLISDRQVVSENAATGYSERCMFCKSTGEHNILLDSSGYCPKCKLNVKGMAKSTEVKVSDDEVYKIGGRKLKDDKRKRLGLAQKEQIISYAGQKKRTRNRVAGS